MSDSSSLPWFRMWAEAIDDPKLRLLAFEDRWHFVALMCCKAQGLFDAGDDAGRLHRKLAVKMGVQARELEEIIRRLGEEDLVDEFGEPLNWDKRQYRSDHDPTRAERQKKHREKKKIQAERKRNALRDANVTRTETEADTETEITTSDEVVAGSKQPPPCPHEKIIEAYHEALPMCPQVRQWHKTRRQYLQARWRESEKRQSVEWWRAFFQYVASSCPFLVGRVESSRGPPFQADLEWLVRPSNFTKVIEGRYEDQRESE